MVKILSLIIVVPLLAGSAFAQKTKPLPTPTPERRVLFGSSDAPTSDTKPGELRLIRPFLKEEVETSEIEPRFKLFQMNVRFMRGAYSVPVAGDSPKAHQYAWDYYPDATLAIQFFEYPAGSFSKSPDERKIQAAKMFESGMIKGGAEKLVAKDVMIGSVPATEYEFLKDSKKTYGRTFVDNDVWYVLLAQPKADDGLRAIQKAFNSFALVKSQTMPSEPAFIASIVSSGDLVEDGIFRSTNGKFSIAIPSLPTQTLDNATEKAKAKNVDVGKQFVWIFGGTFYTIYYTPPVNHDGDASPQQFADIETGTRKGILNGGATIISEKPIEYRKHRGTEFRYSISNGVRYINRVFLIGDRGYQVMGGYAEGKDEQKIIDVLNSFTPNGK
ncbi:MAG: hypothetical protein ACKVQJ_04760 [Pyrinomonadaceae bacterium]